MPRKIAHRVYRVARRVQFRAQQRVESNYTSPQVSGANCCWRNEAHFTPAYRPLSNINEIHWTCGSIAQW